MWFLIILEALTRLLSVYPSSPLSQSLLPILLPSNAASPQASPQTFLTPLNVSTYLALFTLFAGTLLRHACFSALGRHFSFTHTTLAEHSLISSGPYAYARHPSYTGEVAVRGGAVALLLREGGYAACSGALSFFASEPVVAASGTNASSALASALTLDAHTLVITLARLALFLHLGWNAFNVPYLLLRAKREDAALRAHFGAQWDEYAKRVPCQFVPGLL